MAVLANESGMNSEENKQNKDSSHEFNLYVDRQLQNKLLQAEDDLDYEEYESRLSNQKSGNNLKSTASTAKSAKLDPKVEDITGWFPDAKFIARRMDGAKSDNKSTKDTFIHPWKDYKSRREGSFVFKHYSDFKLYIEQYRNEHGCHNSRFSSGTQVGEMRRMAFQTSAPPQPAPVQVSIQQVWNGASPNNQTALHYTNRKEQLGTLITTQPNSNCSCAKNNHTHIDLSSQPHRYKLSANQFSRTNTEIRSHHGDSDSASESGDVLMRSPARRISSATSTRGRPSKSPTKITVPANPNPRAYPIQALTIQQNGKTESTQATKPLDNLNCVAPEKQTAAVERKPVDPIGLTLKVQSFNDLLSENDAPLRGYALPKSTPPKPNHNNEGSTSSDTESVYEAGEDIVSLDQLSTCPLSADVRVKPKLDAKSSQVLQMFLTDPVLSRLNQRPQPIPEPSDKMRPILGTPNKLFSGDSFTVPQNDVDAMLRVNMWNPIISTSSNPRPREQSSQQYRNMMMQVPFRKHGSETKLPKPAHVDTPDRLNSREKQDYFNSSKSIKLSITRLNNAVSFCRTQVQSKEESARKRSGSKSRKTNSMSSQKSREDNSSINKSYKSGPFDSNGARFKPPLINSEKSSKPNKLNMPLPQVKILESVPAIETKLSNTGDVELPYVDNKSFNGFELEKPKKPQLGSAKSSNYSKTEKLMVENHDVFVNLGQDMDNEFVNFVSQNDDIAECKSCKEAGKNKELETNVEVADEEQMLVMLQGVKINVDTDKYKVPANKSNPKKLLKGDPALEGLTWAEKLELLRSVNKPPEKMKPKRQKIKFVKDVSPESVYMWASEHEQLYEQRRIRHLVEQARVKGGKQFDWVYEAQMKTRGIDWGTGKIKVESGDRVSSGDSSQSDDGVTGEERRLGRYGINIPPKGAKQKLFNTHGVERSNTYIAP